MLASIDETERRRFRTDEQSEYSYVRCRNCKITGRIPEQMKGALAEGLRDWDSIQKIV